MRTRHCNFITPSAGKTTRVPCAHLRDRQPEILSQRAAVIFLAEQATPLKLWDAEANEILIGARHMGSRYDKTVARALDEPLFEAVGDLFRAADDRVMHPS